MQMRAEAVMTHIAAVRRTVSYSLKPAILYHTKIKITRLIYPFFGKYYRYFGSGARLAVYGYPSAEADGYMLYYRKTETGAAALL